MTLEECFDEKGFFIIQNFDPYRKPDNNPKYHELWDCLFYGDDDKYQTYGQLRDEHFTNLVVMIKNKNLDPFSDAVQLMWAASMGANTKGQYPAIYMWR